MAEQIRTRRRPRLDRMLESVGKSRLGVWFVLNVANPIDKRLLPLTRGRYSIAGNRLIPVGLLTTTGAKSGQERPTPLAYLPDGDNVVLIASKGGSPKHPAWYHNIRANPEVRFLGRKGERTYRAHDAKGKERERLWAEVNDLYAGYETYQGRTGGREIPVVVLEPKG